MARLTWAAAKRVSFFSDQGTFGFQSVEVLQGSAHHRLFATKLIKLNSNSIKLLMSD